LRSFQNIIILSILGRFEVIEVFMIRCRWL